jgi:vacuolar iron transporter family protein
MDSVPAVIDRRRSFSIRLTPAAIAGSLRDVILGGQDGLVNVLGLTLGMAAATGDARVILAAGLAAMMAESIAMAGVAYTASGAERDWLRNQGTALDEQTDARSALLLADALQRLPAATSEEATALLQEAVLRERELRHEQVGRQRTEVAPVRDRRPIAAAMLVGVSTLVGSAIPLSPFLVLPVGIAAPVALLAGATALFLAGVVRARVTDSNPIRAGVVMAAIGLASAAAGYVIGVLLRTPAVG